MAHLMTDGRPCGVKDGHSGKHISAEAYAKRRASEAKRAATARYEASEKGKAKRAQYAASEVRQVNLARWLDSDVGRASKRACGLRYSRTAKGMLAAMRNNANRRGNR